MPILASAVLSGLATFGAMSLNLVRIAAVSEEHERRIIILEAASYDRTAKMAAMDTKIASVEGIQMITQGRLQRIEDKLDRLLERERPR